MFKCDNCLKISQPKERLHRIPTEYRIKEYLLPNNKKVFGYEIVKEGNFCEACAALIKIPTPKNETRQLNKDRKTLFEVLNTPIKVGRKLHDTQIKKSIKKLRKKPLKDKWKSPTISMNILKRGDTL